MGIGLNLRKLLQRLNGTRIGPRRASGPMRRPGSWAVWLVLSAMGGAPLTLLAPPLPAMAQQDSPSQDRVALEPGSTMWFEGTAGPIPYQCRIEQADVRTQAGEVVLSVSIPVEQIDCGRKAMNRDMRLALKADLHPAIHYAMTSYRVRDGDPLRIEASGELTVAGRSRPIRIEASGERLPDRTLRIRGSHAIDMTWFGVDPPKPMMGLIHVDPNMLLQVDVKVQQTAGPSSLRE